jgi:uncharacterized protein YegP (UPF0339 family)
MGKFIITKKKNGEYQFNLKARNGQSILLSEGYATLAGCKNGIDSVIENAIFDNRFDRKATHTGVLYFSLKAKNGQTIGISELYESLAAREKGISSVKNNATNALVVEQL